MSLLLLMYSMLSIRVAGFSIAFATLGSMSTGAEDEAAQLLSNEHALARTTAGMTTEQFTPTAPPSLGIAALPSSAAHYQVLDRYCLQEPACNVQLTATSTNGAMFSTWLLAILADNRLYLPI